MSTTTVGERIRLRRKSTPGFTQAILAEAVGVSRVHVARVECGMRTPSPRLLARISQALNVPLSEIADH